MKYLIPLFLILAGCNFKPEYHRPQMEIPSVWRFEEGEAAAYANIAWWEQFKDPNLTDLIQTALQNNQNLQVATATMFEFFAKYRVALSQFYPQFNVDAGIDRLKLTRTLNFSPFPPKAHHVDNLYHLFLNLLPYEIDFWGRIRNSVESAQYDYFAQANNRRNVIVTLVSQVASSYFQLLEFDTQLKIAQETYQSRVESWDITIKRFNAGLISQLEVKQAESQVEDAEVAMKNFTQFIGQQEDLISTLIGAPSGPIARAGSFANIATAPSIPSGLPSDLLENRPDILAAEDQMISANAQIGVAKANFFPKVSLTGTYGQESTSLRDFLKYPSNDWDVGLDTLTPLYTGGRLPGLLSEAEAVFLETYHSYQQTVLTALQEVNDALIANRIAKEKFVIQTEEVDALTEYLRLSRLRYFNGLNDYLTVLNAETSLFQVQLSQATTQSDLLVSLVNLFKALGQGWEVESQLPTPE